MKENLQWYIFVVVAILVKSIFTSLLFFVVNLRSTKSYLTIQCVSVPFFVVVVLILYSRISIHLTKKQRKKIRFIILHAIFIRIRAAMICLIHVEGEFCFFVVVFFCFSGCVWINVNWNRIGMNEKGLWKLKRRSQMTADYTCIVFILLCVIHCCELLIIWYHFQFWHNIHFTDHLKLKRITKIIYLNQCRISVHIYVEKRKAKTHWGWK